MVPRFTEFYIPVLQAMSDIEPIEINMLIDKVADHVNLSEEDRNVLTESGSQYRYRSNISWAVTDLSQGSFIERVKRGCYVITLSGLELLEENFEKIDRDVLASRSESFRAFMEKKGTRKGKNSVVNEPSSGEPIEEEVDDDSDELISEVSLEELYTTRETLVKAKISTYEIDIKIKVLENESFFNTLLPRLYKVVPEALGKSGKKVTFTVEYIPGREISVKLGDVRKSKRYLSDVDGSIGTNSSKKITFEDPKPINAEVRHNTQDNKESDKNPSLQQKITKSDKHKTKGVWIEPYKDRMIVVKGDINPFSDLFASYGGRIVNNPTEGWKGWIFMNNREEGLRKDLSEYLMNPISDQQGYSQPSVNFDGDKSNDEVGSYARISKYIGMFGSMKRFNFLGITGPHKAVMLIAIFKGIRRGLFKENRIPYSIELENLYEEVWIEYIGGKPTLGAVYPFVHLGREPFFTHKLKRSISDYDRTWNRHTLERYIDFSILDKGLVDLVKQQTVYEKFEAILIDGYLKENVVNIRQGRIDDRSGVQKIKENTNQVNLRESFKEFSLKTPSKHGNLYSRRSVQVYVNALNSDSMMEIVSKYHPSGDIYYICELGVLEAIRQRVDEASIQDKTLVLSKSALALYIKYIQGLPANLP